MLCGILDRAVFRRMACQPAHVSQAEQAGALDLFWMRVNALQQHFKRAGMELAPC
jgi:hypothetical protein